jgi:tRNA(fMet)-specific endonuclease VapC
VTVVELAHGVERAKLEIHRQRGQAFLDDLLADITIYPLTAEIAHLAGRISGRLAPKGIVVSFEDLVIGATALSLAFEVVTENVRHFEVISGLAVKSI